jgi:hypothetical protein
MGVIVMNPRAAALAMARSDKWMSHLEQTGQGPDG